MGHLRGVAKPLMDRNLSFDFEAEIEAKDILRQESLKVEGNTSSENAATRGRHSIVCKHWLKNLCMKGEKCDFLHQYDPNRMPECLFFLKFGKCNDPECVFRHVAPNERPECQRYRLGFCRYGPMCRSRHDRLPRNALPELLPDWFLDSLIINSHLIPKSGDARFTEGRNRSRNEQQSSNQDHALVPVAPGTEQGTIPGLLPPIHGKCRYFFMRSMNVRNIQISSAKGIWATSLGNSQRLRQAFKDVNHVILVFSATESRNFQGYVKMMGEPSELLFPGIWGDLSCRLSANFRVHWIKQCTEPLAQADHIKNPQNEDQPVRRCRDGQELPSSVGERLCRFLWQQPDVDLLKGSDLEFEPRVSYEYPLPDQEAPAVGTIQTAELKTNIGDSAPLAIEDVKQGSNEQDDDRSRPAPVPLGTFQREVKDEKMNSTFGVPRDAFRNVTGGFEVRPYGPAPITFGKALASGSSSLLAAMTEETQWQNHPVGMWPHPVSWRPPSSDWLPNRFVPPAEYYPPMFRGYPHPFPGVGSVGPYSEARPPNYWGERTYFTQPPTDWEGASSATKFAPESHRGDMDKSGTDELGHVHQQQRSRSRGKRAKHRHRK